MVCNKCGNEKAFIMRYGPEGESCDTCGNLHIPKFADVYFRQPYKDPHLIDVNRPEQKDGVWIQSKNHKKEVMKSLGVNERGDKRHGSRNQSFQYGGQAQKF